MSVSSEHDLHQNEVKISALLKPILKRPLIIGASVSANHRGAASPGRQLALRATAPTLIRTLAGNGKPARALLPTVTDQDLAQASSVIGIDLLFWDSTLFDSEESIRAFRKFTTRVMAFELPIALGKVPLLFSAYQPQIKIMNDEINRFQKEYDQCVVLQFDEILKQVQSEGSLHHHGVNYSLKELLPDGLHLSSLAGKVLADRLQDEWLKQLLNRS